jgi:hypothetical protein
MQFERKVGKGYFKKGAEKMPVITTFTKRLQL